MQLPFDGLILERPAGKSAALRMLEESDLPAVRVLRDRVSADVDEQIYYPGDDESLARNFREGFGIGCFVKDRLIAFAFVRLFGLQDDSYAKTLGYCDRELSHSVNIEEVVVDRNYRGNGLQGVLLRLIEAVCVDEGKSSLLACVSPQNTFSLRNFSQNRFHSKGQFTLYGDKERMIVEKRIGDCAAKRALLVIDYTVDFVADDGKLTCGLPGQAIEGAIMDLIHEAQDEKDEIFVLNDIHQIGDTHHPESALFPEHNIAGTPGRALYGKVAKAIEDAAAGAPHRVHTLDKTRYSAFCGSTLFLMLQERNVQQVVLCGVCTDICILHTAIDAYQLGLQVVVPQKAVASFNPQGHAFALAHFRDVLGATVY